MNYEEAKEQFKQMILNGDIHKKSPRTVNVLDIAFFSATSWAWSDDGMKMGGEFNKAKAEIMKSFPRDPDDHNP